MKGMFAPLSRVEDPSPIRWGIDRIAWARERLARAISVWPSQFRLMFLSVVVGIIAGLGAIFFDRLLAFALAMLIRPPTGYGEPGTGAQSAVASAMASIHSLWFLIIPALGGLLSGLIVYSIAPEAEGHGTDAMIESFHCGAGGSASGSRS